MNTPPTFLPYNDGDEDGGGSMLKDWSGSKSTATTTKATSILQSLQNVANHAGSEMAKLKITMKDSFEKSKDKFEAVRQSMGVVQVQVRSALSSVASHSLIDFPGVREAINNNGDLTSGLTPGTFLGLLLLLLFLFLFLF
jgi:hypothetical protein